MKKIQSFGLFFFSLILFSSCTISEELDLSGEPGSQYKVDIDMSQAMSMMKSMGGAEQMKDSSLLGAKDSSFTLFSQIDTIREFFTDNDLAYFFNAKGRMKMNLEENQMTMQLAYPVKDLQDMKRFLHAQSKVDSIGKAMKDTVVVADENEMPNALGGGPKPDFSNMMTPRSSYIITDTSISRESVDKEKMQTQMGEMKGMEMFLGQMSITTTIRLPRPAKTVKGENVRLLGDRKTIVIASSMQDLLSSDEGLKFFVSF
jgi:hypothetical protein